jgi:hypothetical protein
MIFLFRRFRGSTPSLRRPQRGYAWDAGCRFFINRISRFRHIWKENWFDEITDEDLHPPPGRPSGAAKQSFPLINYYPTLPGLFAPAAEANP